METKPVKANLFRFVTLRNPQIIEEKDKDPGFIFHPDETQSDIYENFNGINDDEKAQVTAESISDFQSSALKTRTEVRRTFENLYDFSSWLMKNKTGLSFKSILQNKGAAVPLTAEEELNVWENLIYQTIAKTSVYVREACIQLLVTNKFLKALDDLAKDKEDDYIFTESELKIFTRRAHASVVISKSIFAANAVISENTYQPVDEKTISDIKATAAKYNKTTYSIAKKELKKVEDSYNKDYQEAYDTELNRHNTNVESLIAAAEPTVIERVDELGNITKIDTYPDLVLPEFQFEFNVPIDESYLTNKVSASTLDIFKGLEMDSRSGFLEIFLAIDNQIKAENQIISKHRAAQKKHVVKVKGAKFTNNIPLGNPYCFTAVTETLSTGEYGISMSLNTDYPNAYVTASTFQVEHVSSSDIANGLSIIQMDSTANTTNTFFIYEPILIGLGSQIRFSGEFTLDNGITYTFNTISTVQLDPTNPRNFRLVFSSCAKEKDGTTAPQPEVNTTVYGVSKLGIADFRRVEQEVCCYVPGEVSHIENVMAREYKERTTRSLVSSEITNEQTDERERENLTDTTTTERNEMQSEVSQVLNEDQALSFGANTNVNSELPGETTLNVGAFFDSSSASSTSNSNSQAQTYAQEVTERAMERIVSKTQTKRTSRILKEFEENTSHGYDNRKGENHISGVYRWVDKIYKNSLINYGKRLMYEFAIPEPSKFFKQAIIKAVETNTTDSAVILPTAPVHPSQLQGDLKLNSATDLREDNYQEIAAEYNADVSEPKRSFITIGESFSNSGGIDGPNSFDHEVEIPEGYNITSYTYDYSHLISNNVNIGVRLHIGNQIFSMAWQRDFSGEITSGLTDFEKYTSGVIPISISGWDLGAYALNVNAKCKLNEEALKQWQNETYNAIMDAYYKRLQEYNDAVQAEEIIPEDTTKTIKFNPLENRAIEKRELKRIAIELLAAQKGHNISKDNYSNPNTNGVSKVNKTEALNVHAATVKFFEQAFDWEIMAYTFYPYFYADESNWEELFQQQDAADPIFQAFLQSGMARAIVPVRQGFEDAVNWYMETGELWNGQGLVVDTDDDLYISVAEEMQTIEGVVESSWETRLPTSLTVIQAGAIGLNVEGLPCNEDCNDFKLFDSDGNEILDDNQESFTNPIQQNDNLIGGKDGL